ncbi:hypothetical protein QQS21_011413 [Conoideocrella luteorostrata]|uniref:Condensation domain-containing protein n=1 Tax=Conoideocrella luteorostrata TaxID=1105319 RepID=A0AAJ0CHQ0_9HYPO|nr:hypothetical protein QQS21_011413 [Conoideocrella luteorostrata]
MSALAPSLDYNAGTTQQNDAYPLTKSQSGIWLEYQKDTLSTKYNLTLEIDFANTLIDTPSVSKIVEAIYTLTQRNTILRSTLSLRNGDPCIQEHRLDSADPEIRIIYRRVLKSQEPEAQLFHRPFQLEDEFAARWIILQGADTIKVYMIGHHIIVDGHSMSLLSSELLEILARRVSQLPVPVHFSQMGVIEVRQRPG